MYQSESIIELAKALSKFQGEVKSVPKDSTAKGTKFSYKYVDLATIQEYIRGILAQNGLAVVQEGSGLQDNGSFTVTTRLLHSSGEWIESTIPMRTNDTSPQGIGSAITYGRRYGFCALLGIVADDDDDAEAAQRPESKPKQEPKPDGLTIEQKDTIQKLAKEKGYSPALARSIMLREFHVAKSTELTSQQASEFIEILTAGKYLETKQTEMEVK